MILTIIEEPNIITLSIEIIPLYDDEDYNTLISGMKITADDLQSIKELIAYKPDDFNVTEREFEGNHITTIQQKTYSEIFDVLKKIKP
jgi:hypothetical protein